MSATAAAPSADGPARWSDARLALALLAVDPAGLQGVALRAAAGPVRDAWLAHARRLWPATAPWQRMPLHITDDRLLGGLDLAATLSAGKPVARQGLLADADGGVLVVPMAERLSAGAAARLAAALDHSTVVAERDGMAWRASARFALLALDEGVGPDEGLRAPLVDRLAFALDLHDVAYGDIDEVAYRDVHDVAWRDVQTADADDPPIADARARLAGVDAGDELVHALAAAAQALGVASLRALRFAVRCARAHAALCGRLAADRDDAQVALRLVLAPRATRLPELDEPAQSEPQESGPHEPHQPQDPQPQDADASAAPPQSQPEAPMEDLLIAAAEAALPPALLAQLRLGAARAAPHASAGVSGATREHGGRGRPAGSRRGAVRAGARLDLIDTLRAAAPWQRLRRSAALRRAQGKAPLLVHVRPEDFHVRRHVQRSETTTVFVVDASGSSALHRLAEAKGAVELLLADCYVRRDRVAVVAFRGRGAQVLLAPTRSLVRAKRSLAGLPGGGGTPLAAGLDAGRAVAEAVQRGGGTPALVVLTDGRANVARDGTGGRERAREDALAAARALRASRCRAVLIDTSPHSEAAARELAAAMQAVYQALPHADAQTLSRAVRSLQAAGTPAA